MSIKSEVLEIVREMGPIKAADVHNLMPHVRKQQVFAALSDLERVDGKVMSDMTARNGNKKVREYVIGDGRKKSAPAIVTDTNALLVRIAELEAWQTDAISRFPDLAVPSVVIRARQIAASATHDKKIASNFIMERNDNTLVVRAVVAALELAE